MPFRYGIYEKDSQIEDLWNKTIQFWKNKKAKIKSESVSKNSFYRKLIVRKNMSLKIYASSMGETYEFLFGFDPEDNLTRIAVKAKFSIAGRGFVWKIPQEELNEWADNLDLYKYKLIKKENDDYLYFIDQIQLSSNSEFEHEEAYCGYCGASNNTENVKCSSCGSVLDF